MSVVVASITALHAVRRRVASARAPSRGSTGQKDLSFAPTGPTRRPGQLPAIGRGHRQPVEAVRIGDADRLLLAVDVDHEQLEVLEPSLFDAKMMYSPDGWMYGAQLIAPKSRDLPLVGAVQVHRPDVGDQALLVESAPDDPLAVGREERSAVVTGDVGQTPQAGPSASAA